MIFDFDLSFGFSQCIFHYPAGHPAQPFASKTGHGAPAPASSNKREQSLPSFQLISVLLGQPLSAARARSQDSNQVSTEKAEGDR